MMISVGILEIMPSGVRLLKHILMVCTSSQFGKVQTHAQLVILVTLVKEIVMTIVTVSVV